MWNHPDSWTLGPLYAWIFRDMIHITHRRPTHWAANCPSEGAD